MREPNLRSFFPSPITVAPWLASRTFFVVHCLFFTNVLDSRHSYHLRGFLIPKRRLPRSIFLIRVAPCTNEYITSGGLLLHNTVSWICSNLVWLDIWKKKKEKKGERKKKEKKKSLKAPCQLGTLIST